MKTLLMISALTLAASSAFAYEANVRAVPLTDGATVYVFQDGTMAMQDTKGRVAHMKPGASMRTADGKQLTMVGNEVIRLDQFLTENTRN